MMMIQLNSFILVTFFLIGASLACQMLSSGLSNAEKNQILQHHNQLRQAVANGQIPGQPYAENMQELQWDYELEAVAQRWASNCYYAHNSNRHVGRFLVGENIGQIWSTAPLSLGDFVQTEKQGWFDEYLIYRYGQAVTPAVGHYTQWVWANTNRVGCGFSYFYRNGLYTKFYVCNYGPAGNAGNIPYAVGYPNCAKYGMGRSSYAGLCQSSYYNNNNYYYY